MHVWLRMIILTPQRRRLRAPFLFDLLYRNVHNQPQPLKGRINMVSDDKAVQAGEQASTSIWQRFKEHPLARIGPGLITGVADDDPSGIATYSQAGAQYGLDMLWTLPASFPLMAAVQLICARIGRVTGRGLAANIKLAFSPVIFVLLLRCC